jgi:hypothetical protein
VAGTIIRVRDGRDAGDLRLMQETAPDAAAGLGGPLPACFRQAQPGYRVVNFDLNYASINEGQRGTAPTIRVTIARPGGVPMIAADPDANSNAITCQTIRSYVLSRQPPGWQLVLGLTLRVPRADTLTSLHVTIDGHAITVPLVLDCGRSKATPNCFDGTQLGGPWIAGDPDSPFLRL